MMMKSRFVTIGIVALLGLAVVLGAWQLYSNLYTYQGALIEPPVPAADFELTDQNGGTFRLGEQQGKVVLIFFGYTYCPDVCPVTLSEFRRIKTRLGKDAENVEFVFVTVDPERDTPERLAKHMANFDPEFVALTGEQEELEQVWKSYGVYREKVETTGASGYLVDHTARVYVVDKAGNWRMTFPFGMEVEKMTQDVAHLLRER